MLLNGGGRRGRVVAVAVVVAVVVAAVTAR